MATLLTVLGGLLGLGGLAAGVIYYLRRAVANSVAVDQMTAAAKMDADRAVAADKAAADSRTARLQEFDNAAAKVTTANDAAILLRKATGADDPGVN